MKKIIECLIISLMFFGSSAFADWDGSSSEPKNTREIDDKIFYEISNPEELAWFAEQVNSGKSTINAVLVNDIKFMDDTNKTSFMYWTPIGKDSSAIFNGIFDGAGRTIYGLYSKQERFAGIFGVTDSNAVIRNVSSRKASIKGGSYAGGIVALNAGTVTGCTNSGTVFNSSSYGGGIAGWNGGTISGCTNSGAFSSFSTSSYSYGGGIAGWNGGTVTNCKNLGRLSSKGSSGGLVGRNASKESLSNSFSVTDSARAGIIYSDSTGTVTNCYYDSDVLPGKSTVAPNSGMHSSDMQSDRFAWVLNTTNGMAAHSGVWSRNSVGYPIFADSLHKPIYKVVFDDSGATSNRFTNYKGLISFPENPEPLEGEIFFGWYTDDNVKVKETTVFTKDMTVYAVYCEPSSCPAEPSAALISNLPSPAWSITASGRELHHPRRGTFRPDEREIACPRI